MTNSILEEDWSSLQAEARRIAYRYSIPNMDRVDVESEALIRLVELVRRGEHLLEVKEKVRQAIRNLCKREVRRNDRRRYGSADSVFNPQDDTTRGPEARALDSELLERMRLLLTPMQFRALELLYFHDATDDEVCAALGIDSRALARHRCRALKRLRIAETIQGPHTPL